MPNSYFRFKQFTIQQERCVMKVCTDSCILGAWTALRLGEARHILDIGTGTGLLALMLSQKKEITVDAIESDPESAGQARENILHSPWVNRINILEGDARHFSFENPFDFIITNPPFFESDLHSPVAKKNKAKHDQSLTLAQLMVVISHSLHPAGQFSILLPFHRSAYFEELAAVHGFSLREKLIVRQTPGHEPFRSIALFGCQKPTATILDELIIRDEGGRRTAAYDDLMHEYY